MPRTDDAAPPEGRESVTPGLAVAAVAQRLGVAPATLRTWDRRYGLGPSDHTAGAHRRYSPQDVERLLVMRRLTLDGVAPADAARAAREAEPLEGAGTGADDAATDRAGTVLVAPAAPGPGTAPADGPAPPAGGPLVPGAAGEPVVGAAVAHHWATAPRVPSVRGAATPQAVVDAAVLGDEARCAALLDLGRQGDVERWWTALVEPAAAALARRTEVDRPGVEAATVLRCAALGVLRARMQGLPAPGAPVVLLLVPAGEERPLLVHALAAALATRGRDARVVAGPVRPHQVAELAVMTRPSAVVVVSRRPDVPADAVERLVAEHPEVPQFLLVPDAAAERMPWGRAVHRTRSFTGALHEVLAVGPPAGGPTGVAR